MPRRRWSGDGLWEIPASRLGGGYGRITEVLEERIGRTFMLDYSLSNLRRASSKLVKTTLVRSSLDRLPFDDSVFDFVAIIRVIHHIHDPAMLLAEVVRVSRDGGTFVLGIANEDNGLGTKRVPPLRVTSGGHRIYPTPLGRFGRMGLERVDIRGVGAFDNLVGRRLERLSPLASLDVATSRLWPAKPMLFVRYRVKKGGGKNEPKVKCSCGGAIVDGRCNKCGRPFGKIIDLVGDDPRMRAA